LKLFQTPEKLAQVKVLSKIIKTPVSIALCSVAYVFTFRLSDYYDSAPRLICQRLELLWELKFAESLL
jgi:hypothetical protein